MLCWVGICIEGSETVCVFQSIFIIQNFHNSESTFHRYMCIFSQFSEVSVACFSTIHVAAYRTSQKPERNGDRGSGNGPAGEEALGAGGSEAAKLTTVKGTGHPNSGENGSKRRVWRR